ncbi:PREDICTED: nucleolar protein 14-like [Branchiostoma belcheri]|uniref:Nucleolar protein 14-like n=1 Tax=Branchiostoma belcheri TaxID=7741 RepID=A0A6P4Z4N4_BRABE|nr:PREDICTED: nucleolar protein 14-like [Branchiostoma belcheri]
MKHKYSSKADFVRKNKKKAQTDVKSNPFEVRINRQKHNVLGKKLRKFDKGMPGVSRSKAIKKRKATLLQEYQQRDKRNQFVDRRLGENDPEMTLEDKMLQRFAMERKTHHEKASAFSLNEEEELTHFGQSLSQIEKFEEPDSDSDDDATGKLSGEYVKEAHFGGFLTKKTAKDNEEKSDKPKSRQEMIEEIIAQSKQRKHERQHQKEQTDDLREKLDQQWTELQNHMLVQKKSKSQPKEEREKPKPDDYDIMVRELGFEIKAKASDRLKTEEELAREEQERLQKLEADRQLRMKGLTQEDIRQQQQNRHVSADDLDDGFDFIRPERLQLAYKDGKLLLPEGKELMPSTSDTEDKPIRRKPHSEAAADQSEDEDKEDQSEEENSDQSEGEDSDQSEEEDDGSDLESEKSEEEGSEEEEGDKDGSEEEEEGEGDKNDKSEQETEVTEKTRISEKERKAIAEAAKTELPYTFKAPESLKDLMELMEGQSYDRQLIIIHRIRKCHHPSLAEGNKKKLQDLFSILLEYFGKLANQSPVAMEMIDGLTIHLYELAQQSPGPAAESVQTVLKNKYHKFDSVCQRKGRAVYPAVDTLLLLKLVSVIFPTSDFRHSVVTPAMLFMAQILTKCPVTSGRDVACGLFVCTLFLQYVSLSKRFVPEVINYLHGLLYLAVKKESGKASVAEVVPPFKHAGAEGSLLVLQDSDSRSIDIKPLALDYLSKNPTQDTDTDDFRMCATHATLQLTNKFANMYKNLPAFHETFSPIRDLLSKHLVLDACPQKVQAARSQFLQLMTDHHSQATYPPLQYEKLKPKPLKLYEPKFDEDYNPERKMKGSRKQKEKERLQKMHKRELKGAVREIRKDAQFLARQQLQDQMDKDAERKRKVKEIMHHLSSQEGECKQIAKKKIKIM